jgi:YD repeat-containing protein
MLTEITNRKKLSVFPPRLLFITALTILSSIVNAQTQRAIDGELATCKVTWDDKVFQSKLNQIGCFDLPPAFPSDAVVFIEINYPNANIGDRVILSVQDGGQLDNGKDVKVQKIDNNKNLIFSFHLYDEGLHRVILRKGNDSKTVQLWGKNNVSITAEDTTHESGNPDKNPGDSCKPCKSKTGSNPFNSYNGNVHREIKDLEIWGGAGEIPLVWMRYGNSRTRAIKANYGQAHEWSSSFQYTMTDAGTNKLGQEKIKIDYPEQGHNIFTQDKMNPALWLTDSGVDKRLFQEGNNFFLQTGNGFRYRFEKLFDLNGSNYYQLQDFRDSYQNLYTLSYIKKHLSRITEPAGRYLEIVYKNLKGQTVIDSVKSSDGRSVIYHYSIIKDSLTDWVALDTVYYGDGTKAIYTYSQKGPGSPLRLEHAIDPRNEATDVDMKYIYDTQRDIAGFIKEERNGRTGEAMATLTVDHYTRTVCYPNGRVQTLVFPDSLMGDLHSYTDGLGGKTKLSYQNGTGFAKTSTDELGRTTIYNNTTIYGNFLKITHPDGSIERWTRDDLDLILTHTDELGRITTYTRDNNHRVKRIDYADGSYETLTYNKFGEVLEYKRVMVQKNIHSTIPQDLEEVFVMQKEILRDTVMITQTGLLQLQMHLVIQ